MDTAVTDRIDESMHFHLPTHALRKKMLIQYFNQYLRDAGKDAKTLGVIQRASAKITVRPRACACACVPCLQTRARPGGCECGVRTPSVRLCVSVR